MIKIKFKLVCLCQSCYTILPELWQQIVGSLPVLQQKSSSAAGSECGAGHAVRRGGGRRGRDGGREKKRHECKAESRTYLTLQPKCEYCKSASAKLTKIEENSSTNHPSREAAKSMR